MEVVESVQEAPEPQVIVNENAQWAFENVALPTYEEMMFQDWLVCGNVERKRKIICHPGRRRHLPLPNQYPEILQCIA